MKQLVQDMKSGETNLVEVPAPQASERSALIRTAASLVSVGTERMVVAFAQQNLIGKAKSRPDLVKQTLDKARREGIFNTLEAATNRLDRPLVLGYSSAGTIVEMGVGLEGFSVGDRVACGGGGFAVHAEYASVPQNLLVKLPDSVDFESAAFATLGAVALQGFRLAKVQVGESVVVIGLGLLGLLSCLIAKAAGCKVIGVDLDPTRLEFAEKIGINAVHNKSASEAATTISCGYGADAVLICADTASDDPVNLAGEVARSKANIVAVGAVGMHIPRKIYYEKELEFIVSRSYGPGRYDPSYEEKGDDYPIAYVRWTEGRNMQAFIDLLADNKIDVSPLVTHRFDIEEAPKAYKMITSKNHEPFLGVLITYPQSVRELDRKVINTKAPEIRIRPGTVLSLGVLGAGNYALSTFLRTVQEGGGVAPAGIISASGVSAQYAANKYGFGFAGSDPDILFDDPTINIIAILTRHHLHTPQIIQALNSGKHVFCEKPLAIDISQLKKLQRALTSKSKPLLTAGFNRRFAPMTIKLKDFLKDRTEPLIAHYRVNAGFIPGDHWIHDPQQGGGRIIGEVCHFVDFLTYIVGDNPVEVQAKGLDDNGKYHQDNVVIHLTYPDGSLGMITYVANGDRAVSKEYVEVYCGGRLGILDDFRTLELAHHGKIKRITNRLRQDKGHMAIWKAFLNVLQTGGEPPIPYNQLLVTTQVSFAAVESLKSGKPQSITIS